MNTRIIIKKSEEVGKIPTSDQLTLGELALNTADGKLYAKKTNDTVTEIGAQPTSINYSLLTGTVPTWNQNTTGNAATATTATSATTAATVTTAAQPAITSVGTLTGLTVTNPISGSITGNAATATNVPYTGLTGTVPTWNQNTTGNAATVTNGVYTTSTATVTNTMLSGSIENNKLTNSSVTINSGTGISGGATVSLGGSVTLTNSGVTSVNSNTGAITGIAVTSGTLGQFSATTSAQLAGLITDETGSGSVVFGTSPSISTLAISTTGTSVKTAAINMAQGVTAGIAVDSVISLNAYNADSGNIPAVPYTRTGYITADVEYDLRLRGSGDSYISILNNSISIGDVDGNFGSAKISFDTTEYVTVTGKLLPNQLVYELDEANGIPAIGVGDSNPIYMKRWNSNASPVVYTYPFYVNYSGEVTALSVTASDLTATNSVTSPFLYSTNGGVFTDSVVASSGLGQGGTLYINCDWNNTGEGGGNSITHIGDLAGDVNNTYLTVNDSSGIIEMAANNGSINFYGSIVAANTASFGDSVTIGTGLGLVDCRSTTLTTTTANQTIYTLSNTGYRSAEFSIQASTAGGAYEALKIVALHDGTNTWNTQYGVVRSGASLGTYTTIISFIGGGSLRLRVTPTTVNTTYKVMITALPV